MDLGIKGKRALVCASSKGLGRGCAEALAKEGVNLVLNARDATVLESVAAQIRQRHQVDVETVVADISNEAGCSTLLASAGDADILINNGGGPPPGKWQDWARDDFIRAIDANLLTPVFLMKALMPRMIERGWGRVVNITSYAVRAPIPHLGLSNTARAGLTGYVAGTARQVAPFGVTINNLLPGIHDTERGTTSDRKAVAERGITLDEARAERFATIPARRYGTVEEFGATCAFLCSTHAGFIVGQNITLDGGAINSTI